MKIIIAIAMLLFILATWLDAVSFEKLRLSEWVCTEHQNEKCVNWYKQN